MNKIYKVVWSKVKHCYVVTSELAKRQTKGCGARSLRMATVSMGVAAVLLCTGAVLPIFCESVAEARGVKCDDGKYYYDDNLEWNGSTKAVTITAETVTVVKNSGDPDAELYCFGNISHNISGSNDEYKVNIVKPGRFAMKPMIVDGVIALCYDEPFKVITQYPSVMTDYDSNKDVSGYSITINNTSDNSLHTVYGGYSKEGNVSGNSATITNGTITANVYGGFSQSGSVVNNEAIIINGSVGDTVYGGKSTSGAVTNNKVTMNGGTAYKVYGASTQGGEAETNHVVVNEGIAGVSGTIVSGGELYGAYSYNDSGNSGDVTGNTVTIDKGIVMTTEIYGGNTKAEGTGNKSGDAIKNIVTINGGTLTGDIFGGYSSADSNPSGKVDGNEVNITGGVLDKAKVEINGSNVNTQGVRFIYGGYTYGNNGPSESTIAYKNAVTISGGTFNNNTEVTGGYSNLYNAELNTVSITEDFSSTVGEVTGGISVYNTAKENSVTIAGGTVSGEVYGGKTDNGTAGGAGADAGNKVNISGGAVSGKVYGGYSNSGAATGNTVSITGGTVSGYVYGGYGESGNPTKNSVIISGGTFNGRGSDQLILQQAIFGGYNHNDGSASDNTVTISGGTFIGSNGILIQGGRTYYATGTTNNNIVNLTGTVTGLEKGSLLGGGSNASNTGNELHVGGIKGGANGVWQGKTGDTVNNKVKYVANFDKVVLHSVKWDKDVAALEATMVNNVKTLDITDLKFYTDAEGTTQKTSFTEGESMALLKSDSILGASGVGIGLVYKDGSTEKTATSAELATGVTLGGGATDKTEDTGVNGVKLTQSVTEKVKLSEDEYAIKYSCEVGEVKKVTFNASTPITFADKGIARDLASSTFASSNTVDADGLTFADSSEAIANGAFMTLVANATGITTTVANDTGKTIAIKDYEDAQKIKYSATATGTVSSADGAVKYTVGSVTVSSIDLSGWTGTASDLTQGNTSGWTGAGVSVAGSFTAPDIAANSSQDIVITNKSGFFTDDAIDDSIKYAVVAFSDDEANGVTLAGSQSKGVQAVSDGTNDGAKLVYAVGKKDVTGITLGNMKVGDPRDMNTDYNFAGVTTLDASALTFDKPENVNADINLVTNATNLLEGKTADHTQDFTKTAANSVALTASLKGTVATVAGAVNYTYSGTALKTINLANWNGSDAAFDATGWTLAKDNTNQVSATVETDGMDVSSMKPGDEKPVLTVTGVDLTGIKVVGDYEYKANGESIAETPDHASGVTITAGTTTGGGVKVNDSNANQLIYQQSKKDVTGITLGSVAYTKGGKAREFDSAYDLTTATINADGFCLSNGATATMNAGETMVVVDATQAIKGTGTATLKDFTTKTMDPLDFTDAVSETMTFAGKHTDTLEQNSAKTQILYKVGDKNVETVTLNGSVMWNDSKTYYTNDASKYKIGATNVNVENLIVTGTTTKEMKTGDAMTLLSSENMTATIATDQSDANKTASKVSVSYKNGQGVAFAAEAKGAVATETGAVKYNINEVKLTDVDLSGWTGSESSVPDTWTADDGSVKVAAGSFAEPDVAVGSSRTIMTAGGAFFDDANISGENKYDAANGKAFSETQSNVTVSGTQAKGVATADGGKSLVYKADIKKADTVSLGSVNWQKDAVLFDGNSATEYDYAAVTAIGTDKFDVTYAAPEKVAAGESMTLLKANETLTAIVNEEKEKAYSFTPVSGVTVDAAITGKLTNSENNVVFTAAANQASKLTFGDVEWKDSGALLTRPGNITFAGADVDTSKINFTNMIYLDADRQMTLVSDFGDKVGTITGSKYRVGTAFEGEGAASLSGKDLIFRTKTGAGVSEQTHKTVMATEAGVTALNVGSDYIGKALDGMGDVANVAPDGSTVGAAVGGGKNRYETGSHVNVNSWNAAVAVGAKREIKNGSLEYGVFGEYGKANYTLHSDAGRGDGDAHYAGGGLVAKWTNKHDVYTEASFRLGRLSESSSDIMRDGLGNKYGYDVHANYYGAHVGVGKIFRYNGGRSLDVYGKYFYTKRDGVEFDAVQHYNLDSVASSVLRIGARYGTTDKKWNWYGGLAYEYEFDGEAEGVVNGVAIRAASIKGSSVRGEIGLRMNATKTNPWQTDISIYGYGGKHRGFGGNVNVAYMF